MIAPAESVSGGFFLFVGPGATDEELVMLPFIEEFVFVRLDIGKGESSVAGGMGG